MKCYIVTRFFKGNELQQYLFEAYYCGDLMYRWETTSVSLLADLRRRFVENGYYGLISENVHD